MAIVELEIFSFTSLFLLLLFSFVPAKTFPLFDSILVSVFTALFPVLLIFS